MGWDSPVEDYMDEVEDRVTMLLRRIGVYALKGVVSASPVQDGPFRGNHWVGIGKPVYKTNGPADKSGSTAVSRGEAALKSAKNYPTIWISNAMPYANRLEHGWSDQAPQGIYSVTFTATLARFEHELREA